MYDPSDAQLERAMEKLGITKNDTKSSGRRKKEDHSYYLCLGCWKEFKRRKQLVNHIMHSHHQFALTKVKSALVAAEQDRLLTPPTSPERNEVERAYMVALTRHVFLERLL